MFDLKVLKSALDQLHEEKGIPQERIIDAIETALAAAYKKDYGKKGQIVRAEFDMDTGATEFSQVKIVVDESTVRMPTEEDEEAMQVEEEKPKRVGVEKEEELEEDVLPLFNPERHILVEDAQKIKKDVELDEEIIFPLETKDDYGRIAAQTAKQVIIQKIREAEKDSVLEEYGSRKGDVVSGIVQRVERGNVFVELGRVVAMLPYEEQIPGEHYRQGARIKACIIDVSEGLRGVNIRLSRSHSDFLVKLFEVESPEIANEVVEIKAVAREPGSRSKIAVVAHDDKIDPIGALVGQRGVRVNTVSTELAGEKIDIIEWSEKPEQFVADALSPAKILKIETDEEAKGAKITVADDQMSLAIGKGGQNVRLAHKLTGWSIDIEGAEGTGTDGEEAPAEDKGSVKTADEIEQEVEEEEIAEDIVEEETGEVRQVETEDSENTTPEEVEEEVEEVEEAEEEKSNKEEK
ncbi:transcription termination factor NusA [Patescibacteria group bacterium]